MSCPCFFLISLKVLFQAYNFITKRITRSQSIVWNKNTTRSKTGKTDISSLLLVHETWYITFHHIIYHKQKFFLFSVLKVFHETNNYLHYVIKQILKQVQDEQNQQNVNVPTAAIVDKENTNRKKERLLLVPYQGKKRDYVIKSLKKRIKCLYSTHIVTKIAYVGNNLSTCFRVKDFTKSKHNHDIIYQGKYTEIGCNDHYLAENGHRILERVLDHAGRDQNSHLFKLSIESGHPVLNMNY